jgi:ribonuclease BN (tRNA processing enzyme)
MATTLCILPDVEDVLKFTLSDSNKCDNDSNNKIRENILKNMNYLDDDYLKDINYGIQWSNLKEKFNNSMNIICPNYFQYKIKHKAGRTNNYDYEITFLDEQLEIIKKVKLEFKYNASSIDETPQFVSPMNPSQYLQSSYEEYYYDNYLIPLFNKFGLEIPEKINYLKTLHTNKPKCVEEAQLLYYQGCKKSSKYTGSEEAILFYKTANQFARKSISTFIQLNELNKEKLSEYLLESQKDKIYLLYKNNSFFIETASNEDDLKIESYVKNPEKFRYEAITKSNKKNYILLRWKNGNGIAYPAFQIS